MSGLKRDEWPSEHQDDKLRERSRDGGPHPGARAHSRPLPLEGAEARGEPTEPLEPDGAEHDRGDLG